jgi:hypothetical protein
MNNYSIEKFYATTSSNNNNFFNLTCGTTNSLVDTACNAFNNDLNNIRTSGNPFGNKHNSLNFYNVYINSSVNIKKIEPAINKLNEIKSTLYLITKLEKLKKIINDIIIAYNNNNNTALTEAVRIFTNMVNYYTIFKKYKIPSKYVYTDLITIQTMINSDYDATIITKTTQKDTYNTIIRDNISNIILEGIDTDFLINKMPTITIGLSETFIWNDIIKNLNNLNILYNYYKNSEINYKNATNDEVIYLSKMNSLFTNTQTSLINYCKALIGISQTIDPRLLNIQSLISYPNM